MRRNAEFGIGGVSDSAIRIPQWNNAVIRFDDFVIIAFGFANLAMLGWLAAAAAPLLIHLWNRRKFREVPWAAVAFLMAAMRKNARRIQIQQWLLLAVRTAIIALVVLAVAEPYGERLAAGVSTSPPTHKVLVLDDSLSMAYRPQDESLWQQAKKLAAELVADSRSGDVFTVIAMGDRPRTILDRDLIDRAAVATRIDALPQTHGRADLPATLTLVESAIHRQERDRFERQEVYFFTDLQRATWELPATAGEFHAECGMRIKKLAERATLLVVDVGRPRAENLAVTRLVAIDPFVVAGREATFEATVRQFGDQPRRGCVVELLVDDLPVGQQTVDVPAGSETAVRFTHRFVDPGGHTVAVRAGGDRLEVDNTRRLVVRVRDEVRVLCVAGRQGDAKYVADALNPEPEDGSALRPIVVSEGDLAELELTPYDCIFMCNVAQLSAGEAERLRRYAERGGGVVFFLGDRVLAEQYNALAAPRGRESLSTGSRDVLAESPVEKDSRPPLLPARLGELVSESPPTLDPLDYRHPIVAPFRAQERGGLLSTPVARYFRLIVSPQRSDVEVALATGSGDPLIVTAPVGRGRSVLVATAGSLASVDVASGQPWTLWPTWPSFLPIVRELVAYAAGGERGQWQQTVGRPLTGSAADATAGDVIEVTRPDGRTDPIGLVRTADGWQWLYDDTDVSGVYTARYGSTDAPTQFAVNVDPAESDLAKVDPARLPSELLLHHESQDVAAASGRSMMSHAAWHLDMLWATLALVLLELWLAWQFGRGVI
jgi:hypothetical protein